VFDVVIMDKISLMLNSPITYSSASLRTQLQEKKEMHSKHEDSEEGDSTPKKKQFATIEHDSEEES
jgi:hypothetical protein